MEKIYNKNLGYLSPPLDTPGPKVNWKLRELIAQYRRFQNTLVVLHKSGLLEITLKTKELIRQNQATQVELDQLKEQTRLFIEATKSRAPQAWARLQASLTSGSGHSGSDLEAFCEQPDM